MYLKARPPGDLRASSCCLPDSSTVKLIRSADTGTKVPERSIDWQLKLRSTNDPRGQAVAPGHSVVRA